MGLTEFSYVVLGDEPAGLWLLRRLAELLPAGERLLWIRFDETLAPVAVPPALARSFKLALGESWSPEILTPTSALRWRADEIARRFPELSARVSEPGPGIPQPRLTRHDVLPQPRLTRHEMHAVRSALRNHPELLAFAQGVWRRLGRSYNLHAETLVSGALFCAELAWWEPQRELPERVEQLRISPRDNAVEAMKTLRDGALELGFHGIEPVVGRRWILNSPWHRLLALSRRHPDLVASLNVSEDLRAREALCALRVTVRADALPIALQPLTIRFDTDEIPDLAREVWPIELLPAPPGAATRELALWATVPRELSLDAALDALGQSLGRLNGLVPFVAEGIEALSVPLSMDSCFTDEQRGEALDTLERSYVELHDYTSLQTQTRLPGLKALLPSHYCNLPHPIGPLHAARRLLEDLVGRKRLKQEALAAAALPPSSAPAGPGSPGIG